MFEWKCASPGGKHSWTFTARRSNGTTIAEYTHEAVTSYPAAKSKAMAFFKDRLRERAVITAEPHSFVPGTFAKGFL